MRERCVRPEEFAGLDRIDPEDPRRAHLHDCPRCRGLLAAYHRFLEPGAPPAGADLDDAESRLSRVLRSEIGAPDGAGNGGVAHSRGPTRFFPAWLSTAWKPAIGLAGATAVTFLVLRLAQGPDLAPRVTWPITPRGGPASEESTLALASPEALPGGSVRFRWHPVAGADRYELLLYGLDLVERARLDAGAETLLVLSAVELGPLQGTKEGSPAALLWEVTAFRAGDPLRRSLAQPLRLP